MGTKLERLREILQADDGSGPEREVFSDRGEFCTGCFWDFHRRGIDEGLSDHEVDCAWLRIDAILAEPEGPLCGCGRADHYGPCVQPHED